MLILGMKGYIFILGISILYLIVVSQSNFVNAVNTPNSVVKKPANLTLYTENPNILHPSTSLQFSPDTSSYLHWKLSGR